jgi:hypothetical protein
MRLALFLIGAIVLIVFAIIATAATSGELFGVSWFTWLCAALLSYFVDLLTGWGWANGAWVRGNQPRQP